MGAVAPALLTGMPGSLRPGSPGGRGLALPGEAGLQGRSGRRGLKGTVPTPTDPATTATVRVTRTRPRAGGQQHYARKRRAAPSRAGGLPCSDATWRYVSGGHGGKPSQVRLRASREAIEKGRQYNEHYESYLRGRRGSDSRTKILIG